jgi:hypothetical protein
MVLAMSTSPTSCSFLLVEGLLWSRHRQNKGFLGTIDNKCKAWTKKFCINNKELNFKIDTGADVTVISDNDFKGIKDQTLIKSDKKLSGPGNSNDCLSL